MDECTTYFNDFMFNLRNSKSRLLEIDVLTQHINRLSVEGDEIMGLDYSNQEVLFRYRYRFIDCFY